MSEYEITRSLAPWKGTQSTSYLVVGSQRVKQENNNFSTLLLILKCALQT